MKDFFEENKIDWTTIDEYLKEGTLAALCMALAECHKLLNYILTSQGYRGDSIYEKIHEAKNRFTNLNNLAKGMEIRESIFEEYDKEISKEEIRNAIKFYQEAIKDLAESDMPDVGLVGKIRAWFVFHFLYNRRFFRKLAVWFLVVVLLLIILDATHPGQVIVHYLATLFFKISNFLIITSIAVGVLILIIVGVIFYFEARRKK